MVRVIGPVTQRGEKTTRRVSEGNNQQRVKEKPNKKQKNVESEQKTQQIVTKLSIEIAQEEFKPLELMRRPQVQVH